MRKAIALAIVLMAATGALFATGVVEEEPLGSEQNPLVWSFVSSDDSTEFVAGGQEVTGMVFERTGLNSCAAEAASPAPSIGCSRRPVWRSPTCSGIDRLIVDNVETTPGT